MWRAAFRKLSGTLSFSAIPLQRFQLNSLAGITVALPCSSQAIGVLQAWPKIGLAPPQVRSKRPAGGRNNPGLIEHTPAFVKPTYLGRARPNFGRHCPPFPSRHLRVSRHRANLGRKRARFARSHTGFGRACARFGRDHLDIVLHGSNLART